MQNIYNDFTEVLEKYIVGAKNSFGNAVEQKRLECLNEKFKGHLAQEYIDFYKIADGEHDIIGSILGFTLLPINAVLREYEYLLQSTNMIESYEKGKIREGKYNPMWMPIAGDGNGSFLLLDLAPGDNGIAGQIITWDIDSNKSYVIAQSFQELLLTIIPQALRDGEVEVDDEEEPTMFVWADGHYFNNIEKRMSKE